MIHNIIYQAQHSHSAGVRTKLFRSMTRLIPIVKKDFRHYPTNLRPLRVMVKKFGFLRN